VSESDIRNEGINKNNRLASVGRTLMVGGKCCPFSDKTCAVMASRDFLDDGKGLSDNSS